MHMLVLKKQGVEGLYIAQMVKMLGDPKYGPGSEPHWKAGSACYPDFYKALLDEPSRTKRIEMVRDHGDNFSTRNQ